ncbi:hypothetical protein [Paludisphaera soli]|uniref:hypothetical protein n=1 Tax=Paludisphaera soli TaxID=2712865 RepID=UPI0013EA68A8|nr:hypothetical protein [Paludisphaera soli]
MNESKLEHGLGLMLDPSDTRPAIEGNLAKLQHMLDDAEEETAATYAETARSLKAYGESGGLTGDDLRSWVRCRLADRDAAISRRIREESEAGRGGPLSGDDLVIVERGEEMGRRALDRAVSLVFPA